MGFVWHFQDTRPIETDLDYLKVFHKLGLRVLQLTYNTQNYVGSGCCELHDAGLSSFGREVVEECNRLGMLIDLSHCGYATCWDAIRHTRKPLSLTHVGAHALCPATGRNKPDEILKAVADTGGVIGIAFFAPLVKRNPKTQEVLLAGVDDVIGHIDHVVKLVGATMSGSVRTSATTTREPSRCRRSRVSAATGRSGPTSSAWGLSTGTIPGRSDSNPTPR